MENEVKKDCYIGVNGKKYGPVSEQDIKNLYSQKKINGDTKFARVGDKAWITVSESGIIVPMAVDDGLPPLPTEDKSVKANAADSVKKSKLWFVAAGLAVVVVISIVGLFGLISSMNNKPAVPSNNNLAQNKSTEESSATRTQGTTADEETLDSALIGTWKDDEYGILSFYYSGVYVTASAGNPDDWAKGRYSTEGNTLTMIEDGDNIEDALVVEYEVKGNTLIFTMGDDSVTLTKQSDTNAQGDTFGANSSWTIENSSSGSGEIAMIGIFDAALIENVNYDLPFSAQWEVVAEKSFNIQIYDTEGLEGDFSRLAKTGLIQILPVGFNFEGPGRVLEHDYPMMVTVDGVTSEFTLRGSPFSTFVLVSDEEKLVTYLHEGKEVVVEIPFSRYKYSLTIDGTGFAKVFNEFGLQVGLSPLFSDSTDNVSPSDSNAVQGSAAHIAYKGISIDNLFGPVDDVENLLGHSDNNSEDRLRYDDIELYIHEGAIIDFECYDPSLLEIDGTTLNKNRAELINLLGNPDTEGDEENFGYTMKYYYGGYSIYLELGDPDSEAWRITISKYYVNVAAETVRNLKDEIVGKWIRTFNDDGVYIYYVFREDGRYSSGFSRDDYPSSSGTYEVSGDTVTLNATENYVLRNIGGKYTKVKGDPEISVYENVCIVDNVLFIEPTNPVLGDKPYYREGADMSSTPARPNSSANVSTAESGPLKDEIIGKWKWAAMDSYWEFREDGTFVTAGAYGGVRTGRYLISGDTVTTIINGKRLVVKKVRIVGDDMYVEGGPFPSLYRE